MRETAHLTKARIHEAVTFFLGEDVKENLDAEEVNLPKQIRMAVETCFRDHLDHKSATGHQHADVLREALRLLADSGCLTWVHDQGEL